VGLFRLDVADDVADVLMMFAAISREGYAS